MMTKKRVLIGLFLLFAILFGLGLGLPQIQDGEQEAPPTPTPTPTTASPSGPGTETPSPTHGGGLPADEGTATPDATTTPDGTPQQQRFGVIPSGDPGGSSPGEPTATPIDEGLRLNRETIVSVNGSGYPGLSVRNRTQLTNTQEAAGTLSITGVSYTSRENGLTDPEEPVDETAQTGELHTNLQARIYLEYPNGSLRYLAGGSRTRYSIATLGEEAVFNSTTVPAQTTADVVIDWKIPRTANNSIQSDTITFDIELTLQGGQ